MTTLDNFVERQHQLFGVISRAVESLRKLGLAKTNRGNVKSHIKVLKTNWEKFQANHESVFRSCTAEQKKLSYFKEDLYSQYEEEFLDTHGTTLNILENLDPRIRRTFP